MRIENHVRNEIFAQRMTGRDPRYALLISHGAGGHSGIYNSFCGHHAAKGVDIWAYDAPGHGRSTSTYPRGRFNFADWVEACLDYAHFVKAETGLPVIALGSSLGVGATYSALYSDVIEAAILMGAAAVPGAAGGMLPPDHFFRAPEFDRLEASLGPALRMDIARLINFDEDYGFPGAGEQKRLDPYNVWMYDFASWRSMFIYDPQVAPERNHKPILVTVGENDPISTPQAMRKCADSIAGPVDFEIFEGAGHQLMLFETERFSNLIDNWVMSKIPG